MNFILLLICWFIFSPVRKLIVISGNIVYIVYIRYIIQWLNFHEEIVPERSLMSNYRQTLKKSKLVCQERFGKTKAM